MPATTMRAPDAPRRRRGGLRRTSSTGSVTGPARRMLDFGPPSPGTPPLRSPKQKRRQRRASTHGDQTSDLRRHLESLKRHLMEVEKEVKIIRGMLEE